MNASPPKLPARSLAVLRAIRDYQDDHDGIAPSSRDIQAAAAISSVSVVHYHLDGLAQHGLIAREAELARTTRITPAGREYLVAAGEGPPCICEHASHLGRPCREFGCSCSLYIREAE